MAIALLVGSVAATAAVAASDEAVEGVHLDPANTPNGDAYASIDGAGELRVDVTGLNDRAVTTADSVFTVSSTLNQEAQVWLEPPSSAVSFYRMDTGGSITSQPNAVALDPGETVAVGMRVDTRGTSPSGGIVTVRALVPDTPTPQPGGGGPGADPGPEDPETDSDGETTPPTAEPPTESEPEPGSPDGETASPPTSATPTPSPEVGGFPWVPLLALVAGVVLLPLAFFAYRRRQSSTIRVAVAPESGLRLAPGAFDAAAYDTSDGLLTFSFQDTDRWADRATDDAVGFGDMATIENAAVGPLEVRAVPSGDIAEGVRVAAGPDGTVDLVSDGIELAPGESAPVSLTLPAEYDGSSLAIHIEGHQVERS